MPASECHLVIDHRFNGPPSSANGGYTCGLLAREIDGPAEITLRAPPPLGRELTVRREDATVTLFDGDRLIAEGRAAEPGIDPPSPISFAEAEKAAATYSGLQRHPFPTCFVCGPERPAGSALRIFAGPVLSDGTLVAAPWIPDQSLADSTGLVGPEYVWAALDCPGAFAIGLQGDRVLVLGRLTARVERRPRAGERCVVAAWPVGGKGRKHFAGSAVLGESGDVCARARATWIDIGSS